MIAAQQTRELALYRYPVRRVDLRVVGAIGRVEADHAVFAAEVFERRFLVVDQRDHDLPVARAVGAAHQRIVAVEDAGLDHRIARHLERIMIAGAEQRGGNGQGGLALQSFDRHARSDAAVERELDDVVGRLGR